MRRYTTPVLPITVPLDITQADVYVDLKQGRRKLRKLIPSEHMTWNEADGITETFVALTQEETGAFLAEKKVTVEVNWIFSDGNRDATEIRTINIEDNLLNEVIVYGRHDN